MNPSMAKLRNLSASYMRYMKNIKKVYWQIVDIFPNNYIVCNLYYEFLVNVGIDVK
jgi:hypothetical protein